jgi:hypothetical protein
MGFPLPDDPDVTEYAYFLVAIPNDPVYRQAIKGHFGELAYPAKWGLEGIEPGSYIAAQAWLRAIDETWRLLEMGWPDLVLDYIDEIETFLEGMQRAQGMQLPCCDNIITGAPPGGGSSTDPVPQPVIDAGYATGVDDQEGYASYKCLASHILIDNLLAKLGDFQFLSSLGAIGMALAVSILGTIVGGASVVLVVAGIAIDVAAIAALWQTIKDLSSAEFESLAATLNDNRNRIICAMVQADGIDATIQAFNDEIDEIYSAFNATIIKNLNVPYMIQTLIYGEFHDANAASALAGQNYDPADYECCQDEPPTGYELIPVEFTSCAACDSTITFAGNRITLSSYVAPGGMPVSLDQSNNPVAGVMVISNLTATGATKTLTLHASSSVCSGGGPLIPNGFAMSETADEYLFLIDDADDMTAWSDFISNHTPNRTGGISCPNPGYGGFKRDAGAWSGTVDFWHIKKL